MEKEIESEYKFLVEKPKILDEIAGLTEIVGFRLANPRTILQEDTYLDTFSYFFYINGMQCRIRKKDGVYILTFKTPIEEVMARHDRSEFETEIAPEDIPLFCDRTLESQNLRTINEIISKFIRNDGLVEMLMVQTQRTIIDLLKGDMAVVLDLDRVTYQRPLTQEKASDYEVEVERDNTPLEFLEKITSFLKNNFNLIESPAPKYQRGLGYLLNQ